MPVEEESELPPLLCRCRLEPPALGASPAASAAALVEALVTALSIDSLGTALPVEAAVTSEDVDAEVAALSRLGSRDAELVLELGGDAAEIAEIAVERLRAREPLR